MDNLYITVCEAAKLLGVTERMIRFNISQKRYTTKVIPSKGRGGKQYLIALDSLPEEAQERYKEQQSIPAPIEIFSEEIMKKYSIEQRNKAIFKFNVIKEHCSSDLNAKAFTKKYTEEHGKLFTYRMLNYWEEKYAESGIVGLIDKRGNAKGYFTALLRQNKVTFFKAISGYGISLISNVYTKSS